MAFTETHQPCDKCGSSDGDQSTMTEAPIVSVVKVIVEDEGE